MPDPVQFRVIPILFVTVLLAGCSYATRPWISPEVTLLNVRPTSISADHQTFLVGFKVKNPNDRSLPIKGASYAMEVEGFEVANGTASVEEQIPANSEGVVDLAVSTSLIRLLREAPTLALTGGHWRFRISGILKVAGGYIPIPFRYSGRLDAAQIIDGLMP